MKAEVITVAVILAIVGGVFALVYWAVPTDAERAERRAKAGEMAGQWGRDMGLKVLKSTCMSYGGGEYRCTLSAEENGSVGLVPVICWVGEQSTCRVLGGKTE